ncbi:MAG: efflux RND transporter periplasmic adaptor subunit [Flavobacteriaceae bacterium]
MKKIYLFLGLAFLATACTENTQRTEKSALAPKNLDALQVQKNELTQQLNTLQIELDKVNAAIDARSVSEKRTLVSAITVEESNFEHTVEIQANIQTRQNLTLYPEFAGKLIRIYTQEGEEVKKGTVLAAVDDSGLKEQLDQIELQLKLAETTFERTARLWDQKIGSEMQYLEAKTRYEAQKKQYDQMKKQLAKTKIIAPFSGIIDRVFANQGANVAPGVTPILRIVNLKHMYAEADVPERYLPALKEGSKAAVEIPVLGQTLQTQIHQIGNYIQPSNRTFRIEAPLENPEGIIKPNLNARIRIIDYSNPKALMIPRRIIRENAEGAYFVFALVNPEDEKGYTAAQRFVKLGKSKGDLIEITAGIAVNDLLIDEGVSQIESDQKVKRFKD